MSIFNSGGEGLGGAKSLYEKEEVTLLALKDIHEGELVCYNSKSSIESNDYTAGVQSSSASIYLFHLYGNVFLALEQTDQTTNSSTYAYIIRGNSSDFTIKSYVGSFYYQGKRVVYLSDEKFLLVYQTYSSGSWGRYYAVVGTINGDDSITFGTAIDLFDYDTFGGSDSDLLKISDDTVIAMVKYPPSSGNSNYSYLQLLRLNISDTTVSVSVRHNAGFSFSLYLADVHLSSDNSKIYYYYAGYTGSSNSYQSNIKYRIITIGSSSFTVGSEKTLWTGDAELYRRPSMLSLIKIVVVSGEFF